MALNSHHLIQISIVEEYRIFRRINLDKNDDFVHSTKNVYLYSEKVQHVYFEDTRTRSYRYSYLNNDPVKI
jgi:hypothetical protein